MECKKHQLIEAGMVSHEVGRCIDCGKWSDLTGSTIEIGNWNPECSGADYYDGKFDCAYGYSVKCSVCTIHNLIARIENYPPEEDQS